MHTTQVSITGEDDTKIVDNMTAALDELYSPAGNVNYARNATYQAILMSSMGAGLDPNSVARRLGVSHYLAKRAAASRQEIENNEWGVVKLAERACKGGRHLVNYLKEKIVSFWRSETKELPDARDNKHMIKVIHPVTSAFLRPLPVNLCSRKRNWKNIDDVFRFYVTEYTSSACLA